MSSILFNSFVDEGSACLCLAILLANRRISFEYDGSKSLTIKSAIPSTVCFLLRIGAQTTWHLSPLVSVIRAVTTRRFFSSGYFNSVTNLLIDWRSNESLHAIVVVPQSVITVATHSSSRSEKHRSTMFCSDWEAMSGVEEFWSIVLAGSAVAIRDMSMLVVDNVTSTSI